MKPGNGKNRIIIISVLGVFLTVAALQGCSAGGQGMQKGLQDTVSFITKPLAFMADGMEKGIQGVTGFKELINEKEALEEENRKLRWEKRQLVLDTEEKAELEELSRILHYDGMEELQLAAANVTVVDFSRWQGVFNIDRGAGSGIRKGAAVVNGDGLVGKISRVSDRTSQVTSIMAEKTKISFQIKDRPEEMGVIQSNGKNLTGYLMNRESRARKGDYLVTSGMGTYPPGLYIGIITQVEEGSGGGQIEITAKPEVSFFNLKKVGVVL